MAAPSRISNREFLALCTIVLGGLAVRIAAARAEFWLDEIWSWEIARSAASPWDLLFRLRHDNNHILNTLALWLSPAGAPWMLYRMHSIVAGTAAIVAAWNFAGRFGPRTGLTVALLVAACPWLVWSSAEARGYALMTLWVFVAADALWLTLAGKKVFAPVFWAASILGLLSHPTFLHAAAGFVVWAWVASRREPSATGRWCSLLWSHGPVIVVFAVLGWTVFLGRTIGGAPPTPLLGVALRLIGVGVGGPERVLLALPWVAGALALLAAGLRSCARRDDASVWLFAVSALAMPLFVVFIQRPVFLFERYLFAAWVLGLVPLALGIEALRTRLGRHGPWVVSLVLCVMVAGNVWHVARFLRDGRGDFVGAAQWVLANDASPRVTVTGDMGMRVEKYVRFYAPYLSSSGRMLVYQKPSPGAIRSVEWLLMERAAGLPEPGPVVRDSVGNAYDRVWLSPAGGLGSWHWAVYRKQAQAPMP